jgi:hypothetical protein
MILSSDRVEVHLKTSSGARFRDPISLYFIVKNEHLQSLVILNVTSHSCHHDTANAKACGL